MTYKNSHQLRKLAPALLLAAISGCSADKPSVQAHDAPPAEATEGV